MSKRRPRAGIYTRDGVLFILGIWIIIRQAGLIWPPPEHISIELIVTGGLLCNGPVFIQALTIARTFWLRESPEQQAPDSSSAPSSESSGDDPDA